MDRIAHNKAIKFAPCGRRTLASSRRLWQRYVQMKTLRLFIFSILFSSGIFASENDLCTTSDCEKLLYALDKGIIVGPIDSSPVELLFVDKSKITKIIQQGAEFEVCLGTTRIRRVIFECSLNSFCGFRTDGSISVARVPFEQCT